MSLSISGTSSWTTAKTSSPLAVGNHQLGAPVCGIRLPDDVPVLLEVADELRHRLLGHLGTFGQPRDRGAGVVEVLEHRAVRRPDGVVAALGEPGDRAVVERDERLSQQRDGVDRSLATPARGQCS